MIDSQKNNFKILCTGNPNRPTIAMGVKHVFPNCEFVHLSNGYDFLTDEGLNKFTDKIKDYNVFINASYVKRDVQLKLLKIVNMQWKEGNVFNIGSILEYHYLSYLDPAGAEERLKLRNLGLDMYNENFRVTHITIGGCTDSSKESPNKMSSIHVANVIKYILDMKTYFHVPIIGLENDFWSKGQPEAGGWNWQELKNKGRDYTLYR